MYFAFDENKILNFFNMFKNTFKAINKLSNNNDIKFLVNRSLGIDMSSVYEESTDFSEILSEISSDSNTFSVSEKGVFTDSCLPVSQYETELENIIQSSCDNISTRINAMSSEDKNTTNITNGFWNCGNYEPQIENKESQENKANPDCFINLQSSLAKYKIHTEQYDINEFLVFSKDNFNLSTVSMLQNTYDVTTGTNEITSITSTYNNNLNSTGLTENFNRMKSKYTRISSDDMFKVDMLKNDVNISEVPKNNSDFVTEITNNFPDEKNSFLYMPGNGEETCSSTWFSVEEETKLANTFSVKSKQNNDNVKHVCPYCSKCFKFPSKLKRHIRSHNLIENVPDYDKIHELPGTVSVMEKSNSRCSEKQAGSSKIEICEEKGVQQCPFCSRIFKSVSKLARHIKTHIGAKPYVCQFCSKAFLERFNLLAHVNIHKKEQAYVCDVCEKSFNFKSNLTRHLKSHFKKMPSICNKSGDAIRSEKMLSIHVRNHEEKPFKCIECVEAFEKKSNLKRHLTIHSSERKYPCDRCEYAAKRNTHLKRHIERHHAK